ncbi:MAG: thiamine ABC transporter substrate-binding protein [Bdellovibrio sp.]|nr:thiamine ABC transporter substrate-binding protein [Bdellovibrio sp.]
MKPLFFIAGIALPGLFLIQGGVSAVQAAESNEIVLYTYDSILTKGGLGEKLFPLIEKKVGCKIKALAWGDAGQILTRLQVDERRKKPVAQIVFGIDQQIWPSIKAWTEDWKSWTPKGYEKVGKNLKIGNGFLPFDYSFLGVIANTKLVPNRKPVSVFDLTRSLEGFNRHIVLEDPRTSTPGLSFLLMTEAITGSSFIKFWKDFRPHWLTIAPSWSSAYHLFIRGEAPWVWSYFTSQAYHEEKTPSGERNPYQVVLFKEGQPLQIEGVAAVRGSMSTVESRKRIQKFLEVVISPEAQALIPTSNWMLPVRSDVRLPESFKRLPRPLKVIQVKTDPDEVKQVLNEWARSIQP